MAAPEEVHPLFTQSYALYTPAIEQMTGRVQDWIDSRVTGAYLYGLSRMGKSKAIKWWLPQLLQDAYGNRIAIFQCVHGRQDRPSQSGFVRMLAGALRHRFSKASSYGVLERRIGDFFVVKGSLTQWRQVVLIVDEAQYMREPDYHVLCNLQNQTENAGVRLSVITVGTHQLLHQRQAFVLGSNIHLSVRFMASSARFTGISSSDQLGYVLDGYDNQTEWPSGSGHSFTRYFFPAAYEQGMRFSQHAPILWELYWELAPAALRDRLEVPMEYVARPIEWLCRRMSSADPAFRPTPDVLRQAVRSTDYFSVMRTIAAGRGIEA